MSKTKITNTEKPIPLSINILFNTEEFDEYDFTDAELEDLDKEIEGEI